MSFLFLLFSLFTQPKLSLEEIVLELPYLLGGFLLSLSSGTMSASSGHFWIVNLTVSFLALLGTPSFAPRPPIPLFTTAWLTRAQTPSLRANAREGALYYSSSGKSARFLVSPTEPAIFSTCPFVFFFLCVFRFFVCGRPFVEPGPCLLCFVVVTAKQVVSD